MPLNAQQKAKAKEIAEGLFDGTYLLASDYDGTLAPFVSNPKEAKLAPSAKKALLELHAIMPDKIMIVTGRPIDELNALLTLSLDADEVQHADRLTSINAIGSQGFARRINGIVTENLFSAEETSFLLVVKEQAKALCERLLLNLNKNFHLGLELKNLYEEKGQSFGLHWRAVSEKLEHTDKEAILQRLSSEYHRFLNGHCVSHNNMLISRPATAHSHTYGTQRTKMFEILDGNMVYEFKLRRVSKGGALTEVLALAEFQNKKVIYLGDDYLDGKGTDASAAKVIKPLGGTVVQVIDGEKAQTLYAFADLQIHTQQGMGEFLQEVVNVHHELKQQASANNNSTFKKK